MPAATRLPGWCRIFVLVALVAVAAHAEPAELEPPLSAAASRTLAQAGRRWVAPVTRSLHPWPRAQTRQDGGRAIEIPRLANITIDGDKADWGDAGLRVHSFVDQHGQAKPPEDFDVQLRMGWNEQGLLALVEVRDDVPVEEENLRRLFLADAIEFFVAPRPGRMDGYMLVLSPGLTPPYSEIRHCFFDWFQTQQLPDLKYEAKRVKLADGYRMEVCLPWANLGVEPEVGHELGLQFYAMDRDGEDDPFEAVWYPRSGTHEDPTAMHWVRLSETPGRTIALAAGGNAQALDEMTLRVVGPQAWAGRAVEILEVRRTLGALEAVRDLAVGESMPLPDVAFARTVFEGELMRHQGRAVAEAGLSALQTEVAVDRYLIRVQGHEPLTLFASGGPLDRAAELRMQLAHAAVRFRPAVFLGPSFPEPHWDRAMIQEALGACRVTTTFYDQSHQVVERADVPGRYGAVVELVPLGGGPSVRRFQTLCRLPDRLGAYRRNEDPPQVVVKALQTHALLEQQKSRWHPRWRDQLDQERWLERGTALDDPRTAILLAGVLQAQDATSADQPGADVWETDRQWWVELKRRLYHLDAAYPEPFPGPQPLAAGPAAPVIRSGTPEEAGLRPEVVRALEALCEGHNLAICIARRGVVFFERGYGVAGGRAITPQTPARLGSATKPFGGLILLMLASDGRVALNDPVSEYAPPLRGLGPTMTLSQCFSHTHGLDGHWGDATYDLEERVSHLHESFAPRTGKFLYSGTGMELGAKILELITGEATPLFIEHHLLQPLGMDHTQVHNVNNDAYSIPRDMAKLAQMVLNRGAYGDRRFIRDDLFDQILAKTVGWLQFGIGFHWLERQAGTFGHHSGTNSMILIDPRNEIVITTNFSRVPAGVHDVLIDHLIEVGE